MILCPQCPRFYDRNEIALIDAEGVAVERSRWPIPSEDVVAVLPAFLRDRIANHRLREAQLRQERGASWRCPAGHALPDDFVSTPLVVIGLIGPSRTMKTTYLGRLISQLVEQAALDALGYRFTFADAASRRAYTTKMAVRLERHQAPVRTEHPVGGRVTEPIVLTMSFGPADARRRLHLLFFDVAGEGTGDPQLLVQANTFLHVMDAAMFFVTPRALALPPGLGEPVGEENRGTRQTLDALDHVESTLRDHPRYRGPRPPRDLPAALVLAKADQLSTLLGEDRFVGLPMDQTLLMNTAARIDEVGERPYRVLMENGGQAVVGRLFQLSEQRSIHAVSAMGADPLPVGFGGGEAVFPDAQPFNVVDPLLAILHQLGHLGEVPRDE